MLTINPSMLRISPGDAMGHGAAPQPGADPAGFASLLRQTQAAPAPAPAPVAPAPAESTPPPREKASADAAPNEADNDAPKESNEPAQRTRAMLRGKLRAAEGTAPPPRETPAKPDIEDAAKASAKDAATERCDAPQTQAVATEPVLDPNLMQWLAGLQRAAPAKTDDAPARAESGRRTDETDASASDTLGALKGQRPADLKADADVKDKAVQAKALRADAADAHAFAGVLAEQRVVEKPAQLPAGAIDRTKEVAGIGPGALSPAPSTAAAAPVAVPIATPLGAPDFAEALGLRMAVLAKDGVQTAELHLNPADMGPVSVQIVMDGTQARVDFGADVAATRQAIEAGLPELASALADAGFTLAGGGVSQHAGGRSGGGNADPHSADGRRTRALAAEDDTQQRVTAAARRVVARGGVDLFA